MMCWLNVCQVTADAYGDHQVGCGGNGDRIHRHDSIHVAVFSAAQSAALAPRKEAPSVIPGSSSRPADMPGWKGPRDCARRAPAPRYFAVIRAIAP